MVGRPAFNIKALDSSGRAECCIDFQVGSDLVVTLENTIARYDIRHNAKLVGATVNVQMEIDRKML